MPTSPRQYWSDTRSTCLDKPVGGQKGWRLLSVVELTSLIDTLSLSPSLPTCHPFTNVVHGLMVGDDECRVFLGRVACRL